MSDRRAVAFALESLPMQRALQHISGGSRRSCREAVRLRWLGRGVPDLRQSSLTAPSCDTNHISVALPPHTPHPCISIPSASFEDQAGPVPLDLCSVFIQTAIQAPS